MPTPRKYIENIKSRQLNSDRDMLDSHAGAIDIIQKAFPQYGSFLMEFVQNADDAKSSSLKIEVLKDAVRIANDGNPFNEDDVKSICKVGRSSKTSGDYIGYLGVGFKAVFLISERPEIYSGDFRFKFDKNAWDDPSQTPWQVIPLWIDEPQVEFSDTYKTVFNLPIKELKLIEKISEEIKPEHLNSRILLFLRNVRGIEIIDSNQNFKRRIDKSPNLSKSSDYEIYQIEEYVDDIRESQDKWLVFRSSCEVPKEVKEDSVTTDWKRENVDKRAVLVAFKLGEDDNLVIERKGTAYIGVFSFLPLKEVESGLHFLIQADFLTTPGRGELARDCLWNEWLAKEIYKLIIEKCIPIFTKDNRWRDNFTKILHSPWGGHELFENNIKRPLHEYLETMPCLIGEGGLLLKADEALMVNTDIKELISDDDLKALYPDKKVLAIDCKTAPDIERRIKKGPTYTVSSGVDSEMKRLIKHKAERRDIAFFKKFYYDLYYDLSKCAKSTLRSSELRRQAILLTDTYDLIDAGDAYIKPPALSIPVKIKEHFTVIHPDLSADNTILHFLEMLGVEKLTAEHVQNILKTEEIFIMGKNWETFSVDKKIEEIKECKKLWENHHIDCRGLSFLTLKTKSGKWLKPEQIVFSKEYNPEHKIEVLVGKGLFDKPLEFVSPEFIEDDSDNEIRKWRKFFEELGVDKVVNSEKNRSEKNRIVQRIAILTSLKYETEKKRKPKELGESEKLGYDIESKSETEERCIEVKGTSDSSSSYDIFLTVNEFRTLRDKRDKYFLYVVTDVLKNPVLYVTQGDRLLQIENIRIIIPFSKWKGSIDEEFQP